MEKTKDERYVKHDGCVDEKTEVLTFYDKYPNGLMTPTRRDDCVDCAREGHCRRHYVEALREMVGALWDDMVGLVSLVPMPEEEQGYARRYELIEHLLQNLQERRNFAAGNLSRVRQLRSA